MAGGVQDLAAFGASGWIRKLHLQPLGVPWPEHLLWLEEKLSFPLAIFRPPLMWVRS
jgi:hypothetical protein